METLLSIYLHASNPLASQRVVSMITNFHLLWKLGASRCREVRTPLATSLPSSHSINSLSSASQVNNDKTHDVAINEHESTSEDLTDDITMAAIQGAAKKRKKSTKD
ncbi:hypothetical protein LINPERHAP2_LOCUS3133 [Linum perenne]